MRPHMTRRAILRLVPGLLVVPAVAPSLWRSAGATARTAAPNLATPLPTSLNDALASGIARGLPGVALTAEHGGEVLFAGAAGLASIERQTALNATDRFRIYSIAKAFTATVVLQLVDDGVLSLDDPVARWLDNPAVTRIPDVDRITLRQLLNHTSGVYDFADDTDSPFWQDAFLGTGADWTKVWTLDALLAYADGAQHAPYFAPGEGHHYSNTDYLLLGLVVEQATGHRFADELRARILEPLALDDTVLAEGGAMPEGTIDGYQRLEGALVNVSASNLSWIWAAGGMVSTTADLTRFGRAVFNGELLSPGSFMEMFTFVPTANPGKGEGMGVYRIATPNGELVGMDGQGPGFTSSMMRPAQADVVVVVLANVAPDEGLVDGLRDEAIAWVLAHATGRTNASVAPTA